MESIDDKSMTRYIGVSAGSEPSIPVVDVDVTGEYPDETTAEIVRGFVDGIDLRMLGGKATIIVFNTPEQRARLSGTPEL